MQPFDPLENCADSGAVIKYLHGSVEHDRASLARELHDDLGGLMVSVVMDVAFAEQNLQLDERLRHRLNRVRTAMTEAIDLKRKIIETLRPSILDNFGLFAALRWEVKHGREITQIPCHESYPDTEPAFTKAAAIGLFRIVQESLRVALHQPSTSVVVLSLDIVGDALRIAVSHDGQTRSTQTAPSEATFAVCSIAHRVQAFGGRMSVTNLEDGGAMYEITLPMARVT